MLITLQDLTLDLTRTLTVYGANPVRRTKSKLTVHSLGSREVKGEEVIKFESTAAQASNVASATLSLMTALKQ
jgi:hypothetical protein